MKNNARPHLGEKYLGPLFGILKNGEHLICAHPAHNDNTHCEHSAECTATERGRESADETPKVTSHVF